MSMFVGHDLGTGGNKAVVVSIDGRVLAEHVESYPLHHPERSWAEQDPADWWNAVTTSTRAAVEKAGASAADIAGIGFAGQMLSLVALDADGLPTRPSIIWMDARADAQALRMVRRLGGKRVLHILAGGSPTGKDIVAKVAWLAEHEPATHARTAHYTDATGYLVARATGKVRMDPTAAGATGLLDAKSRTWSRLLAKLIGFPLDRMPPLIASDSVAGALTEEAASQLGLRAGIPVAMGMADIPAAAVGSGAVRAGEAHVYLGTSAWIGVTVARPKHVARAGIASVPAVGHDTFLMIGESETAGACRAWFEQNIGPGTPGESLDALASRAEPGCRGLLFLPWLFGERSPVPDTRVRGGFVNLSLDHGREHLIRALYEGVALNLRWILDGCADAGESCPTLRAIGGGATSDLWLSIIADVTGRVVERVEHPLQAGAVGSALVAAIAAGELADVDAIRRLVRVERRFEPTPECAAVYRSAYAVFRELHPALSRAGRLVMSEVRSRESNHRSRRSR